MKRNEMTECVACAMERHPSEIAGQVWNDAGDVDNFCKGVECGMTGGFHYCEGCLDVLPTDELHKLNLEATYYCQDCKGALDLPRDYWHN